MGKQDIKDTSPVSWTFMRNVLVKALGLFIILNVLFAIWFPLPEMGRLSAYNFLFPGRKRLPYGENPDKAYNMSLFNLEAMLNSHELAKGTKPEDEFRAILIGDSATWGFLQHSEETLSEYLNKENIRLPDGRDVRVYNLGYPVMSLTKDLLMLSLALRYQPDLIIWPITLESLPRDKQLFPPVLQHNPDHVRALIEEYDLTLDLLSSEFINPTPQDRTLLGARRSIADLIRLQILGVMWAATGIDQFIPETYTMRAEDLSADLSFHEFNPPNLKRDDLALDVLSAGLRMAGDIPILIINEPMFISQGENSDIRYNFYYPRWAYDSYREFLVEESSEQGWYYSDLWDAIPSSEFTNSAIHLTPRGSSIFAQKISKEILEIIATENID